MSIPLPPPVEKRKRVTVAQLLERFGEMALDIKALVRRIEDVEFEQACHADRLNALDLK